MMKMMILAPRRPGMTHAQFRAYVTDVHGPLVRSIPEVAADIRHYHYNFPVEGAGDPAFGHPVASDLDIITQGWFDSREAQLRNMAEPRYLQVIRPDEGRFAHEAAAVMHYTREAVVRDGLPTLVKVFYLRRRHPALSRAQFQRAWRRRYPAALGTALADAEHVARYVQNQTLPECDHPDGERSKYYDVIDEFCLVDGRPLEALAADTALQARVRAVEHELLDESRARVFVATTVHSIP